MGKTLRFSGLLLALVVSVFLPCLAFSQDLPCSPPRVAVIENTEYREELADHLKEVYPNQPVESLLAQIRETILAELRENSPRVVFVENGTDCDYRFVYALSPIAAGEDIEVGGVLLAEEIVFYMTSKLVQNNSCGFPGWLLKGETTKDPDVFRAIEGNVDGYGSIENLIEEFERTHRVPPRGPEMEFALTKSFVSPVPGEREMDIRIRVKNCRGEPVFDRHHGQVVLLPRKTERGELKPTLGFPQDAVVTENLVMLKITHEAGGSVTYTLKRGLELDFDSFQIETCGIDTTLVKDLVPPVPIAGIFIEAEPEEPYVYPGEVTTVEVRLFRETPLGEQLPIGNEPVTIEVEGLIDGSLEPKGLVRTDARGRVLCTYRAGRKEDSITVSARYRPEGYPDEVSTKTGVSVLDKPQCFRGTVAFFVEFDYEESQKSDPSEGGKNESRYEMAIRASVQGELIVRPGELEEILSKSFSGTGRFYLFTFSEAETTYCRKKGVKGEVPVRPGNSVRSETTFSTTLYEKDFKIHANLYVDRHTDTYRCSLGFSGLVWKGTSVTHERFYNACTGETRENTFASPEMEGERFEFSTGEFQGKATNPDRISGEKVIEPYMLGKGRVRCTFDFVRIPCESSKN